MTNRKNALLNKLTGKLVRCLSTKVGDFRIALEIQLGLFCEK